MGGAAGGLVTDIMTGGLSFGAGAIAGAVLGAMGAAGLLKGYQLALGDDVPVVRWSQDFLRDLRAAGGPALPRGGALRPRPRRVARARQRRALDAAGRSRARARADAFAGCVLAARDDSGFVTDADARTAALVREVLREVLCTAYPQAANILPRRLR